MRSDIGPVAVRGNVTSETKTSTNLGDGNFTYISETRVYTVVVLEVYKNNASSVSDANHVAHTAYVAHFNETYLLCNAYQRNMHTWHLSNFLMILLELFFDMRGLVGRR